VKFKSTLFASDGITEGEAAVGFSFLQEVKIINITVNNKRPRFIIGIW
jgi:hypothetical protein